MKKHSGFTLIELMITVAVIAILAAIAYPSYQDQVRKARRSDAISTLGDAAQRLERCFSQYYAYNNNACALVTSGAVAAYASPEGYYTISSTAMTANTFTLQAVPTTLHGQNGDTSCAQLTITQTGTTAAIDSSSADTSDLCW
jgi:type IV pilus assembly protein PilE